MAERPEDLNLPLSVVQRIIKESLPVGVVVSKEAKIAIGKAASVFVLYATSCANSIASGGKRKTLSGYDVIQSMSDMEFDKFVPPLQDCYEEFKQSQIVKKKNLAKKKQERESSAYNQDNQDSDDILPPADSEIITIE